MTHASVFSGIGGPEVAASMLGWKNLFHCEINEFGRKVLDYWFPNSKSYEDITKQDFSEWRGKVNVLTGGFPCQPFSYAGKRRGSEDDRYLWPFMFRCIDQVRPDWVVAENVAGITTMVEQGEVSTVGGQASIFEEIDGLRRYRLNETFTMQRICDDLESHGYSVQQVLIPACAVGAPHRRDRVFIIARRAAADTAGIGRREIYEHMESEIADGTKPVSDGGQRIVADAKEQCGERLQSGQCEYCESEQIKFGGRDSESCAERTSSDYNGERLSTWNGERFRQVQQRLRFKTLHSKAGLGRWDSFPTVSPVHRGNDGIPFDVDRLAIPFSKWRTESLKAYGNAIVPQVMYEIFRAIEITEKSI